MLRSCHSGRWRFFKNRPDVITPGRFYFAHADAKDLPYPHDFYSSTWTEGDDRPEDSTGPLQEKVGAWNPGALDMSFPPGIPFGTYDQFQELSFPDDTNTSTLRSGIPETCWTSVNAPFVPADDITNILNCCLRTAYGQLIKWLYDAEFQKVKDFFTAFIGPVATTTTYSAIGLRPAMSITVTPYVTVVLCSGTTSFQQFATQAWQSKLGPSSFGAFRTLQLWHDLATLINARLAEVLSDFNAPLVYAGHSYGAAGCAVACMREKAAGPGRDLFLLTFGMPKPSDQAGIRLLDAVRCVHVWNVGDLVPQLPINPVQSSWFPDFIGNQLETNWGLWSKAPEYRRQQLNGTSTLGHLPDLTADDLIDPILILAQSLPMDPIEAHPIREYVLRSCRGCRCPRWPLPVAVWNMLDIGDCGRRGIRFRAVIPPVVPAPQPQGRLRMRGQVVNFPHAPPLCLSACLHLATADYLDASNRGFVGNTNKFTMAFFFKKAHPFSVIGMTQYSGLTGNYYSLGIYLDGIIYAHVPVSSGTSFGSVSVPDDLDWHHVCQVYDGTQTGNADRMKVYFDGVQQAMTFGGSAIPATTDFTAGSMNVGSIPFATGDRAGDVRYILGFDYALTADEVAGLASNTTNPYTLDPVWFVPFAEGEGTTAKDYSGNFGLLTFHNSASWCGLCTPLNVARLKMHADVRDKSEIGEPIMARIMMRTQLIDATPLDGAYPGRLKIKAEPYVSPLPPATRSLKLNASYAQFQTYEDSPLLGNAFTLFFWGRSNPFLSPGLALSFSNFIPRLFSADVLSTSVNTFSLALVKPVAFTGEHFHASAVLPLSYAWHFYCIELFDVPTFPEPAKLWVDGIEVELSSSYYPALFSNAWFGSGLFRVGTDGHGLYRSGTYKNVGFFNGIWTPEEKEEIMTCAVDVVAAGADRVFEYEADFGDLAWETVLAQLAAGFHGFPEHTSDVPPWMQ